jgi:small subunit ribosomal protein S9
LTHDETPDQPRDEETPEAGAPEENVEPTTSPDEPPAPEAEQPAEEAPAPEEAPAAEEAPAPEAEQAPTPEQAPAAEERERPAPRRKREDAEAEPEVIPGAHLEPDLVLDQPSGDAAEGDEYARYASEDSETEAGEGEPAPEGEAAPAARTPLELAADARYQATGKRKTAVARVVLKPGTGVYVINGKELEVYFPRPRLQTQARQPLEATGNLSRMDVVARIHGGGVAAQAGALRHGIARALVEAEPTLRTELKRRGYLTRDPREVERKKAGLKKARKRPQFSKR